MNISYHIIFIGIVFYQTLFMIMQWSIYRQSEYVYYSMYICFVGLYICVRVDVATQLFNIHLPNFIIEVLDHPTVMFCYLMYLYFARKFLNLKTTQVKVYRLSLILEKLFILFIISKTLSLCFSISYRATEYIFLVFSLCTLVIVMPMVFLMLKMRDTLTNLVVLGSLFYTMGGIVGVVIGALNPSLGKNNLNIMFGVEIGVLCEVLLINTGLLLKNKILHQQVLKGQQKIIDDFFKEQKS